MPSAATARVPPGLAFAVCTLVWSGSWLALQVGLRGAPPLGTAALRAGCAAVLLALLALALRAPRPRGAPAAWAVAAGVVFVGLNFALVYGSAPRIHGGLAALLYATTPLQAALLGPLVAREERVPRARLLGGALGLSGVAVAFVGGAATAPLLPALGVLLGATTSALGTILARRAAGLHPLWLNAAANAAGALVLAPAAALWEGTDPTPRGAAAWAGFLYMLLGGSVLAFLLYFGLARAWGSVRATYVTLAVPFGAMAVGVALADEPLTWARAAGAALVVVGGWLALRGGTRAAGGAGAIRSTPGTSAAIGSAGDRVAGGASAASATGAIRSTPGTSAASGSAGDRI